MAPRFRGGSLLMFGLGKEAALVGDTTTGGGRILDGAPTYKVDGVPVAVTGSSVHCDVHGLTFILRGSAHVRVHGKEIALHGDLLACGHRITVHGRHRMRCSGPAKAQPPVEPLTVAPESLHETGKPHDRSGYTNHQLPTGTSPRVARFEYSQFLKVELTNGASLTGMSFAKITKCGQVLAGPLAADGTSPSIGSIEPGFLEYAVTAPSAEAL